MERWRPSTLGRLLNERSRGTANNFLLLRLLAAMMVVVGHSFPLAPTTCVSCQDVLRQLGSPVPLHGFGVLVFFAISGFLILRSATTHALADFVRSRVLRIFPGLAICALLMAFVVGPLYSSLVTTEYLAQGEPYSYILRVVAFSRHPVFELPGVTFTEGRFGTTVNGSLWTIPLEVRLYILAAIAGVASRRFRVPCLVTIGTFVLLSGVWDLSFIVPNEDDYRLAWIFAIGSTMYAARRWIPMHALVCIALLIAWRILRETGVGAALFNILVAYVTLYVGFLPAIRLPRAIQDYSYGIYLYAFPIQQMLAHSLPSIGPYRLMAIALPLSWLAGMFSWKLVEERALRWKAR
jgi:peptidoglycan/LPS O-acetylase OafA/YrhL